MVTNVICSQHLVKKKGKGNRGFLYGFFNWRKRKVFEDIPSSQSHRIGFITYSDGTKSEIQIPASGGINYQLSIQNQRPIVGVPIDSHRPPSVYQAVTNIPTVPVTANSMAHSLNGFFQQYYTGNFRSIQQNSLFHIKNAIISMSIFGYGNQVMEPMPELIDLLTRFEEKLKIILPADLGFQKLSVRSPDVVLETKSGHFVIDAASGGIIKLIEITWQFFFQSEVQQDFVVTMDEPENHLHPSMQRSFLSNLIEAFPRVQFVVASHSPFVVSSVKDSNVYVLRYSGGELEEKEFEPASESKFLLGRKVSSEKLDTINKAASASEILRDVLGVPATIPNWAVEQLDNVTEEFKGKEVTQDLLDRMHQRLEDEGLVSEYPRAVSELLDGKS